MLRVIDLPSLPNGQHYDVWASDAQKGSLIIGQLTPPVRFDSLYALAPLTDLVSLEINSVDPYTMNATQFCSATLPN